MVRKHQLWRLDCHIEGKRFRMRSKSKDKLLKIQKEIRENSLNYAEAQVLKRKS